MRRARLIVITAFTTGALSLCGASALASAGTYAFELATPNTALAPGGGAMAASGDWIKVTGSGTFNPSTGLIKAKGSFTHYGADGTVYCRGKWAATTLTGFVAFGTNEDGETGGVVSMLVTHSCKELGTHTGIPMTVTSTVGAPPGSTYVEGTTVSDFTVPTGGTVVIESEQ